MMHVTQQLNGTEVRTSVFAVLCGCSLPGQSPKQELDAIASQASSRLPRYGLTVIATGTDDAAATIETSDQTVSISKRARTIEVEFLPAVADTAQLKKAESLLAALIRDMIPMLNPADIQWLDYGQVISPADFLRITGGVAPRRVERPKTLRSRPLILKPVDMPCCAPGPATSGCTGAGRAQERFLRHRFRQAPSQHELVTAFGPVAEKKFEEEPDLRRLSSWAMTGVLSAIAFPVAVAVAYLNLQKGENLRLNTHALVLAGGLMQLSQAGGFASIPFF